MGSDQTFYGLQSKGLNGSNDFLDSIEEMAESYLREIKTVEPVGPYYLGGYCGGGTIALEMAQQLSREGKKVEFVALFETYDFKKIDNISLAQKSLLKLQKIKYHILNLFLLDKRESLLFFKRKFEEARNRREIYYGLFISSLFNKNGHGSSNYLADLWMKNDTAVLAYEAKPFSVKILDFRPLEDYSILSAPELGWEKLTDGKVKQIRLNTYPAGMIYEPFVKELAESLRSEIDCSLKHSKVEQPE
jgi:thioesterase domain-containing protein